MPYDAQRHGPRRLVGPGFHAQVAAVVRTIPKGHVATYGDVAQALGSRRIARQVGFALAALPAAIDVPWWRVVAAEGELAREGVTVADGRVAEFATRRWSTTRFTRP